MKRALIAFLTVITVVSTPIIGAASASPGLNFSNEDSPNPTIVEDELIVAEHDMSDMSGPIDYYNDNGEVETLPATVNDSQTTPVGLRFDKVDAERHYLFPRIDSENSNAANWTDESEYTKSSGSSSSMTISDADSNGVKAVQFAGSVASTESATAALSKDISITSDANKRVMFAVVNVDTLASGATVELRAVDGDGDYRYAEVNASESASADDTIANSTGNGYVFQERLGDLPMAGSGDGSFDSIQKVEVVAVENDATVTVSGLDLDRKTSSDLAEIERDTDGDGEDETTTITNYYEGGKMNVTGLDSFGSDYDNAEIMDLSVYDVQYQFSDLSDSSKYSVEFETDGTKYSYPASLEMYGDINVPAAIDLSHGSMSLEFDQGLITERYATVELASGIDSSTEFGNESDGAFTDVSDSLTGEDTTATLSGSVSSDSTQRVHIVALLKDDEVGDIRDSGAVGPTGSGGDGFFSTLIGKITGLTGAVVGALGLRRVFGGD